MATGVGLATSGFSGSAGYGGHSPMTAFLKYLGVIVCALGLIVLGTYCVFYSRKAQKGLLELLASRYARILFFPPPISSDKYVNSRTYIWHLRFAGVCYYLIASFLLWVSYHKKIGL
jgi:hypothetical protein